MKINALLLVVFILISCKNEKNEKNEKNITVIKEKESTTEKKEFLNFENKNIMDKEFDLAFYEKVKGKMRFKLENGDIIDYISFNPKKGGEFRVKLALPSFLYLQIKYYPNKKIKEKNVFLPGLSTKVGISEYYDEQGNKTLVDEDKKFGKIKYDYILKFLEKKGYINLKTGEGRFTDGVNYRDAFGITYFEKSNTWGVGITEGKPYDGEIGIGEPPAYSPIFFDFDGDTGALLPEGELERRENSTYKTHNGKKYSYKEWQAFEEQEYQKYVANKTKKGFWDRLFG